MVLSGTTIEELRELNSSKRFLAILQEAEAAQASALSLSQSQRYFERSKARIPGGAQTFSKAYHQYPFGTAPLFLSHGEGPYVWDVDGNRYVDLVQGLLPNILGYAHPLVNGAVAEQLTKGSTFTLPHPLEVELAESLCTLIPCAESVRFGKNGSDATTAAVRVARAFTGRDEIACCGYHGWHDWFIGTTTRDLGVPSAVKSLTHTFEYNDIEALKRIFEKQRDRIAAVILEPFNFVEPENDYLSQVKELTHSKGALLIFDEICSGFHFGLGGFQEISGVTPDLACFGKSLGNGLPISAVLGRREVMSLFDEVFMSFTFGGEVVAMAAALEVLKVLRESDALDRIALSGTILKDGLNTMSSELGLGDNIKCTGRPQWGKLLWKHPVDGEKSDLLRTVFVQEVVRRNVLLLATHNICAVHTEESLSGVLKTYASALKVVKQGIESESLESLLEGNVIKPVFRPR